MKFIKLTRLGSDCLFFYINPSFIQSIEPYNGGSIIHLNIVDDFLIAKEPPEEVLRLCNATINERDNEGKER